MTEAEHLRDQAARCLRLARASSDKTVVERLSGLAAEYLERAQAPKGAPPQDQPTQRQAQAKGGAEKG